MAPNESPGGDATGEDVSSKNSIGIVGCGAIGRAILCAVGEGRLAVEVAGRRIVLGGPAAESLRVLAKVPAKAG